MGEGEPEKAEHAAPLPDPGEAKASDSKALVLVGKPEDDKGACKEAAAPPEAKKSFSSSRDRDTALAQVFSDKKMSLIKAWEENQKAKAENKAKKKLAEVNSWEEMKKADVEAELKKFEGILEKKRAEYAERKENKVAAFHKEAEEKRAITQAKRGEEILQVEEMAAKYCAKGYLPKKILGWFNG